MRTVTRFLILILILILIGCASRDFTSRPVGQIREDKFLLPVSQILTPAGQQIPLPDMRPQALALSPNGLLLVTSGKTNHLIVLDPSSGSVLQSVALPAGEQGTSGSSHTLVPDTKAQLSFTGLIFSPDGRRIYMSDVNGSVKVFEVANRTVRALRSIPLPKAGLPRRTNDIPSGLAVSSDGKRLYVVLNLSNRLLEMDAVTGNALRSFDVGVAPYDVRVTAKKAYVSNWGGRRPDTNSLTGPAGRGTFVRVDPKRHIASEGSVSIIDLQSGQVKEVLAGLHASGLTLSRHYLVVANAGSDSLTVLDLRNDRAIETISLKWQPRDYFGASPNALTFDASGDKLYVCNGTQNAIAVVDFRPGNSKLRGLIPVGWFPGAVICDGLRNKLHVANIKGIGSGHRTLPDKPAKFNSHQHFGTLSLVPIPNRAQLITHTRQALANCRREIIEASQLPARPNQPPRPVPERVGEPSVFKHVVYIIKENRTYDQILGDMREGNGDSNLCVFGEHITPNQHKIAREFVLLDNTYCSGINSADGHEWSTTAFATDYLERSFAGFPRSYPDGMEDDDVDALAYAPSGFIWDNAIEHGKSLRDYGEFAIADLGWRDDPKRKPAPKFLDFYRDFTEGATNTFASSRPAIESLRPYLNTNTLGWGMEVPDVFRAAQFIKDLDRWEGSTGDSPVPSGDTPDGSAPRASTFPNLTIICLPNDHTSGTKAGFPTPAASVADNDLAFGQIVEAISRSKFWNETCIFVIEDDPQDGWDHVSGYRTTAYVISPYTKRGKVISTQYNQPGMLRTIELILGMPPMNQMDAAATPMSDCFAETADFTPFTAVTNNIPLDQMNPPARALRDQKMRYFAEVSARLPLHKVDACPEDLLNRIIWHAQKGPDTPFPKWATEPARRR